MMTEEEHKRLGKKIVVCIILEFFLISCLVIMLNGCSATLPTVSVSFGKQGLDLTLGMPYPQWDAVQKDGEDEDAINQ